MGAVGGRGQQGARAWLSSASWQRQTGLTPLDSFLRGVCSCANERVGEGDNRHTTAIWHPHT